MVLRRIVLSLLLVCALAMNGGCVDGKAPEGTGNEHSEILPDNSNWKWNNITNKNIDISRIQISKDGTIYVLSEGVIYSLEGQDMHPLHLEEEVSAFCLLDNQDSTKIIAGTADGNVYVKSIEDTGWEKSSISAYSSPVDTIIAGSPDASLYLGQSSKAGGGLWKSVDQGKTWEKLTDITVRGVTVHPQNPEIIYMVDRLTYMSHDGGNTWKKIDTGANYGVLIHPLQPDTAYLAFARGVVTVTHDGKINSQQQFYLPGGMTRMEYNPSTLNQWALGMWDYPSGTGGLYYTFNGGGRWSEIGEQMQDTRILDLYFSRDGKKLYIGTAGKGLWVLNIEKLK